MGTFRSAAHHPIMAQSVIPLSLTALSLLLLVLVLLSVPGPIKGLYWFSVAGEEGSGALSAGVLGWCMSGTSNCTYAALSTNTYLSTMINTGEALTVQIALPLACYWMLVVTVLWVVLTILVPRGYIVKDLDSIHRHLRFACVEACVLCCSLFGNVLCWLAFGLGRTAYLSVQNGGGSPHSGHAMETTAVAGTMSLLSLFFAAWGVHLRFKAAQNTWKEEAVMVRRRSMALIAASVAGRGSSSIAIAPGVVGGGAASMTQSEKASLAGMSEAPAYRSSIVKTLEHEERLDPALERELEHARRVSISQAHRNSMISPLDNPY